jgi:hypothetical protein
MSDTTAKDKADGMRPDTALLGSHDVYNDVMRYMLTCSVPG